MYIRSRYMLNKHGHYFIAKLLIFLLYLYLTIDFAFKIYKQAVAQACDKKDLSAKPLIIIGLEVFICLLSISIYWFILHKTSTITLLVVDFFLIFILLIIDFVITAGILGLIGVSHCGLGPF